MVWSICVVAVIVVVTAVRVATDQPHDGEEQQRHTEASRENRHHQKGDNAEKINSLVGK